MQGEPAPTRLDVRQASRRAGGLARTGPVHLSHHSFERARCLETQMTTISRNGDDAALGGPARLESRIERVDKSSPADIRSLQWTATLRTVSLVIPAKNEAASIRWVLQQVPDCVDEIILVDGHSTDATIAMANSCWPDLEVLRQQGKGKGDALRAGFEAARGT